METAREREVALRLCGESWFTALQHTAWGIRKLAVFLARLFPVSSYPFRTHPLLRVFPPHVIIARLLVPTYPPLRLCPPHPTLFLRPLRRSCLPLLPLPQQTLPLFSGIEEKVLGLQTDSADSFLPFLRRLLPQSWSHPPIAQYRVPQYFS